MKNVFNKTNAPYLVSGALAIGTLLASGVLAIAPYVGLLAPVAALSVGLPFIVGGAIFSAVAIALSAVVISKNNTISEKDAQLAEKDNKAFGIMEKLSKEGTNLDYLDLAVLSSRQEKQANGLDYLNIDNVSKQFDLSSIDAAKKHLMSLVEKDINEDIFYDAEPGEEKSTENPSPENEPTKVNSYLNQAVSAVNWLTHQATKAMPYLAATYLP